MDSTKSIRVCGETNRSGGAGVPLTETDRAALLEPTSLEPMRRHRFTHMPSALRISALAELPYPAPGVARPNLGDHGPAVRRPAADTPAAYQLNYLEVDEYKPCKGAVRARRSAHWEHNPPLGKSTPSTYCAACPSERALSGCPLPLFFGGPAHKTGARPVSSGLLAKAARVIDLDYSNQ